MLLRPVAVVAVGITGWTFQDRLTQVDPFGSNRVPIAQGGW